MNSIEILVMDINTMENRTGHDRTLKKKTVMTTMMTKQFFLLSAHNLHDLHLTNVHTCYGLELGNIEKFTRVSLKNTDVRKYKKKEKTCVRTKIFLY